VEAQYLGHPRPRRVVPSKERAAPPLRIAGDRHVVPLALHVGDDLPETPPRVEPTAPRSDLGRRLAELEETEGGDK
jgi:hypothetical protein